MKLLGNLVDGLFMTIREPTPDDIRKQLVDKLVAAHAAEVESAIAEQLIALGWTPPPGHPNDKRVKWMWIDEVNAHHNLKRLFNVHPDSDDFDATFKRIIDEADIHVSRLVDKEFRLMNQNEFR